MYYVYYCLVHAVYCVNGDFNKQNMSENIIFKKN